MRSLTGLAGVFILLIAMASSPTAVGSSLPDVEELAFSVRWARLPVVDATFSLEAPEDGINGPVRLLVVEASTTALPSRIYRVDNRYETLLDMGTGLPIRYEKVIDEAYFKEKSAITYAQDAGQRLSTSGDASTPVAQALVGPTHNLFSALYFLRQQNFRTDDPVRFLLDAKGIYWQAIARRRRNLRTKHGFVWEVAVRFTPLDGSAPAGQSDLLTDNIVNGDRPLLLHIHPSPPGSEEAPVVVHMEYRGGGFHLIADLKDD